MDRKMSPLVQLVGYISILEGSTNALLIWERRAVVYATCVARSRLPQFRLSSKCALNDLTLWYWTFEFRLYIWWPDVGRIKYKGWIFYTSTFSNKWTSTPYIWPCTTLEENLPSVQAMRFVRATLGSWDIDGWKDTFRDKILMKTIVLC